ncbi:MAG: acetylxylan esterase [Verrucomicrobiae bacterium]|nr:acetylxylan esterase [Verrucomicrobiae bacterium]
MKKLPLTHTHLLALCAPLVLTTAATNAEKPLPPTLAPWFRPPPEFDGKFGHYRSPLIFDNGSRVTNATEWPRRREEILRYWHEVMGPWPPVLKNPKLQVLGEQRRENFRQQRVRVELAPGQPEEAWLLLPEGNGPFPAVLVLYYDPDTSIGLRKPYRDFGLQLARRGFVTLNVGTPGGDSRNPNLGGAQCQPLSFHAYVAANCWQALANLPQVDATRIGVVGHSYGGKRALFAGALWDTFAGVVTSDPGIV